MRAVLHALGVDGVGDNGSWTVWRGRRIGDVRHLLQYPVLPCDQPVFRLLDWTGKGCREQGRGTGGVPPLVQHRRLHPYGSAVVARNCWLSDWFVRHYA